MNPWWTRSAKNRDTYSRGELAFQGSGSTFVAAVNLFLAFRRFSDGEAWLGAGFLVVALLFALRAIKSFVEIWKGRGAMPPEQM